MTREYLPPEWSAARASDIPPEQLFFPEDRAKQDRQQQEERRHIEGQTWREWWDEIHHQAKTAGSGRAFKEAVERDHCILSRDEAHSITIHSAHGAYGTFLDRELAGSKTPQEFQAFLSSIDTAKLPGHLEAAQQNRIDRVKEFWGLADKSKNAEEYKTAIEQAAYVLARRDDKILVVTPDCVVDDLHRLTPALSDAAGDISDYKAFTAPIAAQTLPSVHEAQAIQDERNGRDPELAPLLRELSARQYREALDLSDKHDRALAAAPDPEWQQEHKHLSALEWEDQQQNFGNERDRYIHEFHEAKRLLDQMRGEEEEKGLGRDETEGLSLGPSP